MLWRQWGLKDNPYSLNEIDETTLDLFVGRGSEIKSLQSAFARNKRVVFIEGERGVGKSSLGNSLRYSSMQKRLCFTPYAEICVAQPLSFYPFILKVLEVLNWSLPQNHPFVSRDVEFKTYEKKFRELFEQIAIHPTGETHSHPEDYYLGTVKELFVSLSQILSKLGYEYGPLIQVSFPELNTPGKNAFQKNLSNLFVIEGVRWLLIGNPMLEELLYYPNSEILSDDLYKISINSLELPQIHELLLRRRDYLALIQSARLPLTPEVIDYLYLLSGGDLKKMFSVFEKISELANVSQAALEIDLKTAKPLIAKYFQDEIRRKWKLTATSAEILNLLVKEEGASPGFIAERIKKLRPNVSRNLMHLIQTDLVRMQAKGRHRVYYPSMEAKIAFT